MNKKTNVGSKQKTSKGTLLRLVKSLFKEYKTYLPIVFVCIIVSAIGGACNSLFLKNIIDNVINPVIMGGEEYSSVAKEFMLIIITMAIVFSLSIISSFVYSRLMAVITQGYLNKIRKDMFAGMQKLPIRYFDKHNHGEIMSYYTNDTDSIRQLISQSLPQLVSSGITIISLVIIMLTYSVWLTLVMFVGVLAMLLVTKKIGGKGRKYFIEQQKVIAKTEGFIEEMMHGQKVVKVFCHEDKSLSEFKNINEDLFKVSEKANKFSNIVMPLMGNIGNILYVLLAFIGGLLLVYQVPNLTLFSFGAVVTLGQIVGFLTMTRSFTMNITQLSQHIGFIVMGLAGAERVFSLMDEQPETDEGYVTLVKAKYDDLGNIVECNDADADAKIWAWKHPHKETGNITYEELKGDVRLLDVDFGYDENKIVLHNVTLYAKPGQKVAFVGSTGAGKTTITNLLNRFYDIADGKIRYDGININKIKKADLRKSIGMVLQDTTLFTGTVKDNIKYGKLNATDDEIIEAAKLANAHDFITRLPDGYDTMLTSDGTNLSQGQRQLLSIARAAVSGAPVMILDEATSSIDTRTELLVQQGTDKLMQGKTVFVIAHRLSTVQNSNVIMVLEHGKIIERGTHEELINSKGVYYQLYTGAFELE